MYKQKYFAKGFLKDAEGLLNDFVEKNSVDFPDFAEVWRKHRFSLIYGGRPDQMDLNEFTNEIFATSCQFLMTPLFYKKVGAVFLLYSLFLSQISDPEIKIRIELCHCKIIKILRKDAASNRYYSLLYVIEFLCEKAFFLVARQTLRGPLTGLIQKECEHSVKIANIKALHQSDLLEFSAANPFQEMKEMHSEYLELKKKLSGDLKISLHDPSYMYDELICGLQELINPGASTLESSETASQLSGNIGSRRAKLKAKSFMNKTFDRYGVENSADARCSRSKTKIKIEEKEDNIGSPGNKAVRNRRPRRKPVQQRRVGRPRKHNIKVEEFSEESEKEEDIDITHLVSQQSGLFLPPDETVYSVKRKTRRDAYYKLSPKREEKANNETESSGSFG